MIPVAVAMSGGVDSLTTAALLRENRVPVFGLHFVTGFEPPEALSRISLFVEAAAGLGIKVHLVDLSTEFSRLVAEPFAASYASGRTPNPCVACNPQIKFGALLAKALALGAEALATGHYARLEKDAGGRPILKKGLDPQKDQSYFLARLTPEKLAKALFPLGRLTKKEVRVIARNMGIEAFAGPESQDVCFLRGKTHWEFLEKQAGVKPVPGPIVDVCGNPVGTHKGLLRYTVGQRRGIDCPSSEPWYVARLEPEANRLVVGRKKDLLQGSMTVTDINWICARPTGSFRANTRFRYRTPEAASQIELVDETTALVRFDVPQAAIAPGQAAVFYEGDTVLGGGWIK